MLTEIYCDIDDFCKDQQPIIAKLLATTGLYKKPHPSQLTLAEIMTILIYYHLSPYKNFKAYYTRHIEGDHRRDFPDLVSYDRFIALIPRALFPSFSIWLIGADVACERASTISTPPA